MKIKYINEPSEDLYLYKFIKSDYLEHFLQGNLYLSSLRKFDEFFEGINYEMFICCNLERRLRNELIKKHLTNSKKPHESNISMMLENSRIGNIIKQNENIKDNIEIDKRIKNIICDKNNILNSHYQYQKQTFANCWFSTDNPTYEPNNMWELYSDKGGILFKTTYRYLKIHLEKVLIPSLEKIFHSNYTVYIGLMKYRDYFDVETWKSTEVNHRAFFKEESFQNEKEFRILVELDEPTHLKGINLTSLIPLHLTTGIFTLHPEDYVEQIMRIKSLVKVDLNYKFELSRLTKPEYDD